MCDSSGQPSHGLHFLGLAELLFQFLVDRDVLRDSRHAVGRALLAGHKKGTVVNPSRRTVRTDDPVKHLGWFRAYLLEERNEAVPIVRVHALLEAIAILIHGCGTAAPQLLEGRAHVEDSVCAEIEHPKDLIDILSELLKPLFSL